MSKFSKLLAFIAIFLLAGCYFIDHKGYSNTTNIELKEYDFAENLIRISLPPSPIYEANNNLSSSTVYSTYLYTRWLGGTAGDYPISNISVLKDVNVPQEKNALMLRTIKLIDGNNGNEYVLFRECFISNHDPAIKYKVVLHTSCGKSDFSTEAERDKRLGIDDKIFDKIVNSILIKNKSGEWIKPPIVIIDDEVWQNGKRQ